MNLKYGAVVLCSDVSSREGQNQIHTFNEKAILNIILASVTLSITYRRQNENQKSIKQYNFPERKYFHSKFLSFKYIMGDF